MKRSLFLIILVSLVVQSGLLYAQSESRFNSLFSDYKAHSVGDILTIHIMEFTSGSNNMSSSTKSENNLGVSTTATGSLDFLPTLGLTSKHGNEYKGKGSISQNGQLRGKLSAIITEVMPNGALKIEGTREVEINGDKQTTILTGWVRPEDISSENVVLSHHIAGAEIRYRGKGTASSATKRGIISKIMDFIF